jgi:16S rRNA (guanine966-N2)-methyltransferase
MLHSPPCEIDLVFIDPPYNQGLVAPTLKSIVSNYWVKKNGIIIVEHSVKEPIENPENLILLDQRTYNNSFITIFKNNS